MPRYPFIPAILFSLAAHHRASLFIGCLTQGAVASVIVYLIKIEKLVELEIPLSFHGLLGVPVGLLLVFRTNTAYERWWEGRKLLGELVNSTRYLAVKLSSYLPFEDPRRVPIGELIATFATSLVEHLAAPREAARPPISQPLAAADLLSDRFEELRQENILDGARSLAIEEGLRSLVNILGACERIKNTPMPMAYSLHLEIIVLLYLLLIPFGLAHVLGWWTVLLVMMVFYIMVGIQFIGEEIEDPFGYDPNDLKGVEIAANIARNVRTLMAPQRPLPNLPAPAPEEPPGP